MRYQEQVTTQYNEHVANIRVMLKRLTRKASGKNFWTDPNNANWGDLGDICRVEIALKELCDLVFDEGEYANS